MMYPLWRSRSEAEVGRGGDFFLRPRLRSGEVVTPPEAEAEGEARIRARLKGKCALGPFLSILVIECQHKCLNVNQSRWMNKVQI
jgi:hypothetical protein